MSNFDKDITYHSMVDLSKKIFGLLFLANGGGVIALLTLVGHYRSYIYNSHPCLALYWLSFAFFILGIIAVVLSTTFAYFTQYHIFTNDTGTYKFGVAVAISIFSLVFFIIGSIIGALFISQMI
ncbi:hypothetical protein HHS34_010005 [Acidithiobacillus montserratensis]|uniref:Uncharacterized protein n=1 Tax=Acidithiobacillus montserratensis TaxID=2729135 RepID=A0ACD5HD44_9PROT|nr:hypothetical protein [Acidithiobacillus montserratensis]MBU2747224.1 hypothetical protein [Acidithiobacillus montserratensis]